MHILDVIGGMPERPLSKLTSTDLLVGNKVGSWQMRVIDTQCLQGDTYILDVGGML